jgi:hypothetical protein
MPTTASKPITASWNDACARCADSRATSAPESSSPGLPSSITSAAATTNSPPISPSFRQDQKWEVKQDAIDSGRRVAIANQPSQLVVHRADGTIEVEWTYDNDPYPPKG